MFTLIVLLSVLFGGALSVLGGHGDPARAAASADSVIFIHRDYDVHIRRNGDVDVNERWEVAFSGATYQTATTGVFLGHTRGVQFDHVIGADTNSEHTANVTGAQGAPIAIISWTFPPTKDATRIFTIPYTLHGALGLNSAQAWLDRHFFDGPGRGSYQVKASRVTVTLPAAAGASDVQVKASYPNVQIKSGTVDTTTVFAEGQSLNSGQPLEVEVVFPRTEIDASVPRPSWQQSDTPPAPPTPLEAIATSTPTPSATSTGGIGTVLFGNVGLVLAVGIVIIVVLGFIAWRLSRRVAVGIRELADLRSGEGIPDDMAIEDIPEDESPLVTKPLPAINLDFGQVEWPGKDDEPDLEALGLRPLERTEEENPDEGASPRGTGAPSGVGQGGE